MFKWVWEGEAYRDDRLFYLDLIQVDKGDGKPWVVITRKNTDTSAPIRVDSFKTKKGAVDYIRAVEPKTPRVSLKGESPKPAPSYGEYLAWLEENDWPSALQLFSESRDLKRDILIDNVDPDVFIKRSFDGSAEE